MSLSYGTVTGTFSEVKGDDQLPLTGSVTFYPSAPYVVLAGVTVFLDAVTAPVVNGVLNDPDTGTPGVRLVASDSPGINPSGFTYTARYSFSGPGGRPPVAFTLAAGGTTDLSTVVPVAASGGVPVIVGPAGPQGAAGPAGATGPAGTVDQAVLASLRGKGLLVNEVNQTPPLDSETALDVVTHGPFTWNWRAKAWFGPAYAVSWKAGDHVGIPVGPWPGVGHATIQGSTSHGATPWESDQEVDAAPQYDFDDVSTGDKAAPSDGSGVIFLIQTTTGYPATPDVPPALDYDILAYLGDLVLTNGATPVPYALDDGDGADGDHYLIFTNRHFFKRTAGRWTFLGILSQPQSQISLSSTDRAQPVVEGFGGAGSGGDPVNDAPLLRFYADTGIGSYPDAGLESDPHGTLLVMGDQPDDSRLVPGRMAIWFDPTPGGAKLMIRAKDAAGTIVTGNLPLTGA